MGSCNLELFAEGGTVILGGTSGTNNETLTFDFETTANQVDIGTGTGVDLVKFDGMRVLIQSSSSGQTAHTSADDMVLESSGNTAYTILSGTGNTGAIVFGDMNDNWVGSITYNHTGDHLSFATNDIGYRFTMDSSGNCIVRGSTTGGGYHILWASGAATFNEQGASVDIRMEGSTITELFFLDGSADTVCIGGSLNTGRFNVSGTTFINDKLMFTQVDENEYIDSLTDGYLDLGATTDVRINNNLDVIGIQKYENAFTFTLDADASTDVVTFPTAFGGGVTHVVICTPPYQSSFWVTGISNTGFTFNVGTTNGYAQTINCIVMETS